MAPHGLTLSGSSSFCKILNTKFLCTFWLPFSGITWYKLLENTSVTLMSAPSVFTGQILVLKGTPSKMRRTQAFGEWMREVIPSRWSIMTTGLGLGTSGWMRKRVLRVCAVNAQQGAAVEKPGLRPAHGGSRDPGRGPHIQPPIKGVKIGHHVHSKQHTMALEAIQMWKLEPISSAVRMVWTTGPGVRRPGSDAGSANGQLSDLGHTGCPLQASVFVCVKLEGRHMNTFIHSSSWVLWGCCQAVCWTEDSVIQKGGPCLHGVTVCYGGEMTLSVMSRSGKTGVHHIVPTKSCGGHWWPQQADRRGKWLLKAVRVAGSEWRWWWQTLYMTLGWGEAEGEGRGRSWSEFMSTGPFPF